jgi:hypothetical protein
MIRPARLLTTLSLLATASLLPAADAKEELLKAAKALSDKPNYTWRTTVVVPEDAQFKPGPTDGKIEKGGAMVVSTTGFQGNIQQTVKQGEKIALTNRDGGWDSIADVEANTEGFGRFRANMARNLMAPADDVADMVKDIKELKKEGDLYSGDFTGEGAKSMMSFGGRRRGGGDQGGPNVPSAKASAKFWVKDGVLAKMEVKVDGSIEFNGNEMEIVRTSTTEIKDVGSTKVEIPEGAKAKLK